MEGIINSIGMKMKLVEAGEFEMGSARFSNAPAHRVKLARSFYMGVYEVTQAEWVAVMGKNPSNFKGDDRPVEFINWYVCKTFIDALNKKEGTDKYRLPTEAEWEYACRAGTNTLFYFGDDWEKAREYAWCEEDHSRGSTHPVGKKTPNPWGFYDMIGNVYEWCEDWYDENYYKSSPLEDPAGPPSGEDKVARGGAYNYVAGSCISTNRCCFESRYWFPYVGFRLVKSV